MSSTSLNLASLCTHTLIRHWQTLSELELHGKTVLVCYTTASSTVSSIILEVCQCWCHTNGQIFKLLWSATPQSAMWALEKFGYVWRTSRPVGLVLACVATRHTFKHVRSYHVIPYPTYGYG